MITISQVATLLGENTRSLKALCTSSKINKWSVRKPIAHSKIADLTDAEVLAADAGMVFGNAALTPYYSAESLLSVLKKARSGPIRRRPGHILISLGDWATFADMSTAPARGRMRNLKGTSPLMTSAAACASLSARSTPYRETTPPEHCRGVNVQHGATAIPACAYSTIQAPCMRTSPQIRP